MSKIAKLCALPVIVILVFVIAGCGSSRPATSQATSSKETIKNDKLVQLMADPEKYKGYPAEITGKIFNGIKTQDGISQFQIWGDPKNNNGNMIVFTKDPASLKEGDFVNIKGTISGKLEGKNAFGATITSVGINSNVIEKLNPMDVLAPTKQKVDVNKINDQNGYSITLQKIEFAESETRAYIQVKNDTKGKINFWSYNTKAIQGNKQFEQASNYEADYPEVQPELLSGVVSEGVITFKPLDASVKSAQFVFEGSFDDYKIKFEPVKFDISW